MCRYRPTLSLLLLAGMASVATAADGLAPPDAGAVWPQWQARITLGSARWTPITLANAMAGPTTTAGLQSGAVLGDYYFDAPGLRLPKSLGGLRASSGLMFGSVGLAQGLGSAQFSGQRFGLSVQSISSPPAGESPADPVPYLGLGYTGLALKGSFSITADLGLVAERPSSLGRGLLGTQGLESTLRELRLSPVLQVGVRYAF